MCCTSVCAVLIWLETFRAKYCVIHLQCTKLKHSPLLWNWQQYFWLVFLLLLLLCGRIRHLSCTLISIRIFAYHLNACACASCKRAFLDPEIPIHPPCEYRKTNETFSWKKDLTLPAEPMFKFRLAFAFLLRKGDPNHCCSIEVSTQLKMPATKFTHAILSSCVSLDFPWFDVIRCPSFVFLSISFCSLSLSLEFVATVKYSLIQLPLNAISCHVSHMFVPS